MHRQNRSARNRRIPTKTRCLPRNSRYLQPLLPTRRRYVNTWLTVKKLLLSLHDTHQSWITDPTDCTGLLSENGRCWLKRPLLPIEDIVLLGDNCCGEKLLDDPGNIFDVGVTWPDKDVELNAFLDKLWLVILRGGCWKFKFAISLIPAKRNIRLNVGHTKQSDVNDTIPEQETQKVWFLHSMTRQFNVTSNQKLILQTKI